MGGILYYSPCVRPAKSMSFTGALRLSWYPPVGVFIARPGVLGVVVPLVRDLARMGKWEKAFWTVVMFALMGLEIRSIYLDRNAHDIEQAKARAEQLQHRGNRWRDHRCNSALR